VPIYDYACRECGNRFELRQSFSDAPAETCPKCGGPVRRVIHPAGVVFKGSGFYKTDYAGNGAKAAKSDDGGEPAAASATESASDTTTESKPEPAAAE
jgi:putative FmdB family regulatory protein